MPISIGTGLSTYYAPVAEAAPPATPFITDTFTGSNGTLLTAHTPDSGGTWTIDGGTEGSIFTNRIMQTSSTIAYHSATPPSANYRASIDVYVVTDNNSGGLGPIVRWDAANDDGYHGRLNTSGDIYQLYVIDNLVFTLLASAPSGTITTGTHTHILVDNICIRENRACTWIFDKTLFHKGNFAGIPNIVLIA